MDGRTPKRRWFQFSLRTLLVFVTLCAIACSWFAVKLQQATRQREAVAEIKKLGGICVYDWQLDANGGFDYSYSKTKPTGPVWLRNLLGDDLFQSVIMVGFEAEREVTDASLEPLKGLSEVRELDLYGTKVTDAGLRHLKGLSQLRELCLSDTQVTDAGLEYLKELTQLQQLDLDGTQVTDAGVTKLQQALPNCEIER
jgi:hypothetical protein